MRRFPCPCCGHLTLPEGPGDFGLCPVCFWEDDPGQLRRPLSPVGANGISLAEAQQSYRRLGAMSRTFQSRVRAPRPDEPLDAGWRPFDPAVDGNAPELDGDRWPVNPEALYYWRPTSWNGDQHRLSLPPTDETSGDRFVGHLRAEVPELADDIAASERRWGIAHPFDVCERAAGRVLAAYADGDDELALRIVTALLPAVDEHSDLYDPECVHIAFLENEGWYEPALQRRLDRWPAPIRDTLRQQQAHRRR
ncbi:CPCC family cysteine-rich protein [Nocardioides sp. BP30]|uniref:CPCC family cysteine-rich protein n=1 Tax=Nocardioides sp. BP30 TaxID=3036374 RepID=UPI0024687785|nr:CPCC family cysteine-rich protein [Nocardioides sp. BP30]WGL51639.1 CPCC family cysteine-rich protein [Nocardioides sp. BP30]